MKKNMNKRKAQVVELGSFILAAIIIVLMMAVTITATFFLSEKEPSITINPAKFARNENDFAEGKYLNEKNEKAAIIAQALLNSKREFRGEKIRIKDALQEWAMGEEIDTQKDNRIPKDSYAYLIIESVLEVVGKTIKEIPESPRHGLERSCYYFKASTRGEKEKTISLSSGVSPHGLLGEIYIVRDEITSFPELAKIVQAKAAFLTLESPIGNIDIHFYYSKEKCILENEL